MGEGGVTANAHFRDFDNVINLAAAEGCEHCEGSGLVHEPCGCYECEYSGKHDTDIPCGNCQQDAYDLLEALSMVSCPYYKDQVNGVCDRGCHQEPVCLVNAPMGGWGSIIDKTALEGKS